MGIASGRWLDEADGTFNRLKANVHRFCELADFSGPGTGRVDDDPGMHCILLGCHGPNISLVLESNDSRLRRDGTFAGLQQPQIALMKCMYVDVRGTTIDSGTQ